LLLFSEFSVSTREIYEAYVLDDEHLENDLESSYKTTNSLYIKNSNLKKTC